MIDTFILGHMCIGIFNEIQGPDEMEHSTVHFGVQNRTFVLFTSSKGRLPSVEEGSGLRYCEKSCCTFPPIDPRWRPASVTQLPFFIAQWAFFKSPLGYLLHCIASRTGRAAGGGEIRGIYISSCFSAFSLRIFT